MNGQLSLKEMVHSVLDYNTDEYEVIMNRIWPPLMVVVSTLVIKRFSSALITATCVSICWFAIFVSGPLGSDGEWLSQWQEVGFQVFMQGILLFGAKISDRKERIDFLNTFGKHLQAERVMKKLNMMREEIDKRAASGKGGGPNTILGDVFSKLSKVQNAVLTMHASQRKQTIINGERTSGGLSELGNSAEEMILIDEVKTMLLNNIDNLQQPVMSVAALHSVPEEERAWYSEGGAGSSRKGRKMRRSFQTPPMRASEIVLDTVDFGGSKSAKVGSPAGGENTNGTISDLGESVITGPDDKVKDTEDGPNQKLPVASLTAPTQNLGTSNIDGNQIEIIPQNVWTAQLLRSKILNAVKPCQKVQLLKVESSNFNNL